MEDSAATATARTPIHLWVVGVLGLLWSVPAVCDFGLTTIRDPGHMALFPAATIQMIDEFPPWMVAAWGLGVTGAMAGPLALLLRSRAAVYALGLSLAGLAAGTACQASLAMPEADKTLGLTPMTAALWLVAAALLAYAVRMRRSGVLR
jgi:hypothetical protein